MALNISVTVLQCGQTNPLIFSTTPFIFKSIFLQKLISFLTSDKATSYGVVTIIAYTSGLNYSSISKEHYFMRFIIDKCSSDVPGGVSIIKYDLSPYPYISFIYKSQLHSSKN